MIKFLKDGYKWLGYLSYSGARRYVQYAELIIQRNGKKGGSWYYRENGKLVIGWKKKLTIIGII